MRKNVVLSLLAMSSATMAAYANADLTGLFGESLTSTTVGAEEDTDLWKSTFAALKTAKVTVTTAELLPGKYTFAAGKMDNAKITINGKSIISSAKTIEVVLSSASKISIVAEANDNTKGFEVGNYTLTLNFDFVGTKTQLTTNLGYVVSAIGNDVLDEWKDALLKKGSDIAAEFAGFKDDKTGYASYKKFELYKGVEDCTIGKEISTLKDKVEAANLAGKALKALVEPTDKYNTVSAALKADYDSEKIYETANTDLRNRLTSAKGEIDALEKDIKAEYEAVTAANEDSKCNAAATKTAAITASITAIDNEREVAVANYADYKTVNASIKTVRNSYNTTLQTLIEDLKVYDEVLAEAQTEMKVILGEINDVATANTESTASSTKANHLTKLDEINSEIVAVGTKYAAKATALKTAYSKATAKVTTLTSSLTAIDLAFDTEGKYTAEKTNIQTTIDALKEAIEAANENSTIDVFDLNTPSTAIQNSINAFANKTVAPRENYAAYQSLTEDRNALSKALADSTDVVRSLVYGETGKTGYTFYQTTIENLKKSVDTDFVKAIEDANKQGKAKEYLNNADRKKDYALVKTAIVNFTNLAKDAQELYTTAQNKVAEYNTALNALNSIVTNDLVTLGGTITGSEKTYKTVINEIKGRIEAIQTSIDAALTKKEAQHYNDLATIGSSFGSDNILSDIKKYSDSYAADKAEYDKNATENAAKMMFAQATSKLNAIVFTLPSKEELGLRYSDIEKEYEELIAKKDAQQAIVDNYTDAEGHLKAEADKAEALATLSNVLTAIDAINKDWESLQTKIGTIKAAFALNNSTYNDAKKLYTKYSEQLNGNGKTGSSQIKGVIELNEDPNKELAFTAEVNPLKNQLDALYASCEDSYKNETLVADWKDTKDKNGNTVKGLESKLDDVNTSIQSLRDEATAATANYKARNEQNKYLIDQKLEANIKTAKAAVGTTATGTSVAYYTSVASGYDNVLLQIKTDIVEYYTAGTSSDQTTDVKNRIDEANTEAKGLKTKMEANETNHKAQLNTLDEIQELWNEVYAYIAANDKSAMADSVYLPQLADCQTLLNGYVTTVGKYFANGQSEEKNKDLEAVFVALDTKIRTISSEQKGGYATSIINDNATRYTAFLNSIDEAEKSYIKAVEIINQYSNVKNDDFRAEIETILENSADVYAYSAQIITLKQVAYSAYAEAQDACDATPESPELYDSEESNTNKANNFNVEINDIRVAFQKSVDETVINKFNAQLTAAESMLNKALTNIASYDASVKANAFAEVRKFIADVKAAKSELGFALKADGLFETYEVITASISDYYNEAAQAQWNFEFEKANHSIEGWKTELKNLDITVDFDDEITSINELDSQATTYFNNKSLYGNCLSSLSASLDGIVGDAEYTYNYEIEKYNVIVADNEAYNELCDSILSSEDKFEYASEYVSKYAISYKMLSQLEFVSESITTIRSTVEDCHSLKTCVANKSILLAKVKSIKKTSQDLISTAYNNEVAELTTAIQALKQEYNDAYANADAIVDVDAKAEAISKVIEYNDVINGYNLALSALISPQRDYIDVQPELLTLETEIATTNSELVALVSTTASAQALADVNDAIAALKLSYEEVSSYLVGCVIPVQNKYSESLKRYSADVEDFTTVKETYDGNNTLLYYSKGLLSSIAYESDMLDELYVAIKDAQKPYAENTYQYPILSNKLNSYQEMLEDCKNTIKSYSYVDSTSFSSTIDSLQSYIRRSKTDLESKYANGELKANSTLLYADTIANGLNNLRDNAANAEAIGGLSAIDGVIDDVISLLNSTSHKYAVETEAELRDEKSRISTLASAAQTFNKDAKKGWIYRDIDGNNYSYLGHAVTYADYIEVILSRVYTLMDDANKLQEDAEASYYIVGDANGDRQITVTDYVLLNQYILDNTIELGELQLLASDCNGDKVIDIADLTTVGKLLLNKEVMNTAPVLAQARIATSRAAFLSKTSTDALSMSVVEQSESQTRVAILLDNAISYVGCQMDIVLPEGMSLLSESLGDRTSVHKLTSSDLQDGVHRIVISDLNVTTFADGSALVYLDVIGAGNVADIQISHIVMSDENGAAYHLADVDNTRSVTGIEGVSADQSIGARIYSVGGEMMKTLKKGINIIRNADGSTTKILKK